MIFSGTQQATSCSPTFCKSQPCVVLHHSSTTFSTPAPQIGGAFPPPPTGCACGTAFTPVLLSPCESTFSCCYSCNTMQQPGQISKMAPSFLMPETRSAVHDGQQAAAALNPVVAPSGEMAAVQRRQSQPLSMPNTIIIFWQARIINEA